MIDAGFLELTRLGELPAHDPDVLASLKVVDSVIKSQTASGPGWHRYGIEANGSTDGYGDCYVPDPTSCSPSGAPWFPTAKGSGHPWPLLDGERAEQDLQTGAAGPASSLLQAMQNMTSGLGLVPEQAWEDPAVAASRYGSDPATASIGFVNGKPAGSASPLIWAQAQYLRLVMDLRSGSLLDQPAITANRYVRSQPPAALTHGYHLPGPGRHRHRIPDGSHRHRPAGSHRGDLSRPADVPGEQHVRGEHGRERRWSLPGHRPGPAGRNRRHGDGYPGRARDRVGSGDGEAVSRRAVIAVTG